MSKEIRMSIPQFNSYNRGELTLNEIKTINQVENIATKIMKNERVRRITILTIASINLMYKVSASSKDSIEKIDTAGAMFLGIFQSIAYWLCLLGAIMEILKCVMNGSSKDVGRIMLKYILIFASIFLIPFAFDLIRDIFS